MISADDAVADDQRARIVDTPPDAVPALSSQNTKERIHGIGTKFPLTVLLVSVSVPELLTPAPALPLRIVSFERVTWAVVLEILTTVPTPPPSIIVVLAPEPITFTIMLMVRFSV